jgi:hypothetical protein
MALAARVAAQLGDDAALQVETRKGGLGEFSVHLDGRKVIDTSRLWYPSPGKVVSRIRNLLAGKSPESES